jgi:uncharacterized phage-like protein YoqJ
MIARRIAITGHRKLWRYGNDTTERLKEAFLLFARNRVKEYGSVVFHCGMAIGTDMVCADVIVDHPSPNIDFIAFVPCLDQEKLWPQELQDHYHHLLLLAKRVNYVSNEPYSYLCMARRNEAMVNTCDEVFAVYDNDSKGGTQHCIKYAHKMGKPVTIWNPVKEVDNVTTN